ncbi:protein SHQ1 homolog isoform X1 [Mobula birostris]|uniref:protein SHQ1 homolog isoform X1 n=1 Tax=Mobula birostris TaxID=1983395 RepID=UPI003B28B7ED
MITPSFELSQDANFLTIIIHIPYAKINEVDLYIDGVDFKFYVKPYFLRLTLPGKIVEDGRETSAYDADAGIFTIKVPKETPEEYFEGLDMLTALLAPRGSRSAKPLVEELGQPANAEIEDEEFEWEIEQTPYEEFEKNDFNSSYSYGFGNLRSGVFRRLQNELSDVIDLKEPDSTTPVERRQRRLAAEEAKFDSDHYLADLFEDDAIQHLLKYEPWWQNIQRVKESTKETQTEENDLTDSRGQCVKFSEHEKEQLRKFTNRNYLLDKSSCQIAFTSLVDILLAYAYEVRSTEGETNTESSWNIWKLSGTLCWLETYHSLQEVIVSFSRRVLCYPFYRHFHLALKAIEDAVLILLLGKSAVLKCLLAIHKIFRESDPAYLFNDLYITDYCIWIQKVKKLRFAEKCWIWKQRFQCFRGYLRIFSLDFDPEYRQRYYCQTYFSARRHLQARGVELLPVLTWMTRGSKKLASLAKSLQNVEVTKSDLGFELTELEEAALLVQQEESKIKQGKNDPQPVQSESDSEDDEDSTSSSSDTGESDSCESDSSNQSSSEGTWKNGLLLGKEADYVTDIEVKEPLIKLSCGKEAEHMADMQYPDKCALREDPTAKSPPRRLIEELADQLQSVGLSEHCEKSAIENSNASEHKQTSQPVQSLAQDQHSQTTSQQTFLEVSPERNCLLLVAGPDNTEDFTNLA